MNEIERRRAAAAARTPEEQEQYLDELEGRVLARRAERARLVAHEASRELDRLLGVRYGGAA
jgi:hypothetical protein